MENSWTPMIVIGYNSLDETDMVHLDTVFGTVIKIYADRMENAWISMMDVSYNSVDGRDMRHLDAIFGS